ncbi:MAG: hypothetical protein JSW05_03360 [Candidatus Thorarchaeota archaeon]|nr:MAG: hypothetical protein JSW05_03360 [Candidatus Thorarchaeota archaeon]
MFRRISGAPTESLCEYLKQIGIDAEVLPSGSPEEIGGYRTFRSGGSNAGCIKVKGQNVDLVQLLLRGMTGPLGAAGDFDAHFVVRGNVEGKEKQLKAKAKEKKEGFVKKKLVDVKWEGGRLAELLNQDGELTNLLVKAGESPEIELDQKQQCVRVATYLPSKTKGISIGPIPTVGKTEFEFPSRELVEACDRIGKHIRSLLV